jgi:small-conductance mechanosensitive channel
VAGAALLLGVSVKCCILFVKYTCHLDKFVLPLFQLKSLTMTKFLLPHKMKKIGWILAVPSIILMIMVLNFDFRFKFLGFAKAVKHINFDNGFLWNIQFNNFTDEVVSIVLITGLLFIAFSQEKDEDERIARLRLESLLWAVLVNTILIMLAIVLIYSTLFRKIMAYNICTPLILFIARFNLILYFERKT